MFTVFRYQVKIVILDNISARRLGEAQQVKVIIAFWRWYNVAQFPHLPSTIIGKIEVVKIQRMRGPKLYIFWHLSVSDSRYPYDGWVSFDRLLLHQYSNTLQSLLRTD